MTMLSRTPLRPSEIEIRVELSPDSRAIFELFKTDLATLLEMLDEEWLERFKASLTSDLAERVDGETARRRNKAVRRGLICSAIKTMRDKLSRTRVVSVWSEDDTKAIAEIELMMSDEDVNGRTSATVANDDDDKVEHAAPSSPIVIGKTDRSSMIFCEPVFERSPKMADCKKKRLFSVETLVRKFVRFCTPDCIRSGSIASGDETEDGRVDRRRDVGRECISVDEKNGVEKRSWPDEWPEYWEGGDPTGLGRWVEKPKAE
ncbi:MAG: hypothetical protein TREMPRED_003465 [Tremellales sp. Tagirdzhanova-0007]|nr:MAG: hypothetical protein TREMPRED_003465 [Tremellales sp. Tagirdzhanova-0007]